MRTALAGSLALALVVVVFGAVAMAADNSSKGGVLSGASADKGPLEKVSKAVEVAKIEPVMIRMYNVQDLTLGRDYPYRSAVVPPTSIDPYAEGAMGGGGGMGGLFAATPEPPNVGDQASLTSAMTPQVIADLIRRTVDSEPWDNEGGRGKIDYVGALLVITQTAEGHKRIGELLDQLRTARPMVTVEARWLLLDDEQVSKIVPDDPARRTVPQEVSAEALKEAKATVIYRGQITCFDRQTVHLASGRGQAVMADLTPVVGENAVGFDPRITQVLWGLLLEVTTSLSPDNKAATLRLHSLITEPVSIRTKTLETPAPGAEKTAGVAKNEIDLPEFLLHTFRTTMRVPVNKGILIGGITAPKASDGKVLYLFMQVSASGQEAKGDTKAESKADKK
jgi:hypothetical protein